MFRRNKKKQVNQETYIIKYPSESNIVNENKVVTSHYNYWNFVFLVLYEQFHKLANFYFLGVAILQSIPQISPLDPVSGYLGLMFMLCISAVKCGYEDYKRHKEDIKTNSKLAYVYERGGYVAKKWEELRTGDIIEVQTDMEFPADVVLIETDTIDGRCRIETSVLDGEIDLKTKTSVELTNLKNSSFVLEVTPPTMDLTTFSGKLTTDDDAIPLCIENFVPRSCILRASPSVRAVIVYAGENTKLVLNSVKPAFKLTEIDTFLNRLVIVLLTFLIILCVIYSLCYYFWSIKHLSDRYLYLDELKVHDYITSVFSWFVLFNPIIPLCVYSSIDLVRFCLAMMITLDFKMCEGTKNSKCRNSDLVSSIGRVTHIFSDKTGTLTKNILKFKAVGFESEMIGIFQPGLFIDESIPVYEDNSESENSERLVGLDTHFIKWICENHDRQDIRSFLLTICLCNSASTAPNFKHQPLDDIKELFPNYEPSFDLPPVDVVAKFPHIISYQTSSPDEIALLHLARECGYIFYNSTQDAVHVIINGDLRIFERRVVFPFHSKRKRMSVVCRIDNEYKLLVKGADNIVTSISTTSQNIITRINDMAEYGLRTLVFAQKTIPDVGKLYKEFSEAKLQVIGSEQAVFELANKYEVDLFAYAVSGVEDQLQENVQGTLFKLRLANISIWMLTGDKLNTSLNIALTSGLRQKSDTVHVIDTIDIANHFESLKGSDLKNSVLAIENKALNLIIDNLNIAEEFFSLAIETKAVICARCEPSQKGNIIRQFRRVNSKAITLAIGDGGNDVDMIRAANIGIGVEGKEGTEAVTSSDFSIPSFRHLGRLLLVHGRWCVNRISLLIKLTFYKCSIVVIVQMLYGLFNGFSATSAFDSGFISLYNIIFTIPQLFFICIFEQDLDSSFAMAVPQVYKDLQKTGGLSFLELGGYYLLSLFHSSVVFFYIYFESSSVLLDGNNATFDHVIFTQIAGWTLLIVFTFALLLRFRSVSLTHVFLYLFCIAVYAAVEEIYSFMIPELYGIMDILFTIPRVWLQIPIIVGICTIFDLIVIYIKPFFTKSISVSVQELEWAART